MQMMLLDRCLSLIQLAYYLIFLLNPFIKHMSVLKTCHHRSTMNTNSIIFFKKVVLNCFSKLGSTPTSCVTDRSMRARTFQEGINS